jgi:hypothetical protein
MSATLSVVKRPCGTGNPGSMSVTVTGGTSPYTYTWYRQGILWGTPSASSSNTMLNSTITASTTAGGYYVVIQDACGTTVNSNSQTIPNGTAVDFQSAQTPWRFSDILCYGGNGRVAGGVTGTSGTKYMELVNNATQAVYTSSPTALFTAQPNTPTNTAHMASVPLGIYTVRAKDALSVCQSPNTYTVEVGAGLPSPPVQPSQIALTLNPNPACFNTSEGQIGATGSGGTLTQGATYQFQLYNSSNTLLSTISGANNFDNVAPGNYTVKITDVNGCNTTATTIVGESPLLTATIFAVSSEVCAGETVAFELESTNTPCNGCNGVFISYNVLYGGLQTLPTQTTTELAFGQTQQITIPNSIYNTQNITVEIVSITDGNCTNPISGSATTIVKPIPQPNAGSNQSICDGTTLTLTGTTQNVLDDLEWQDEDGNVISQVFNPSFTPVLAVYNEPIAYIYTLQATAQNGCIATDAVTVTVNPVPDIVKENKQD